MTKTYIICNECGAINKEDNTHCIKCEAIIDPDIVIPNFESPNTNEMLDNIPGNYLTEAGKIIPNQPEIYAEPEEEDFFIPEPDEFGLNGVLPKTTRRTVDQRNTVSLGTGNNIRGKISNKTIVKGIVAAFAPLTVVFIAAIIFNSAKDHSVETIITETMPETSYNTESETEKMTLESQSEETESETTEEIDEGTANITVKDIHLMNAFKFSDSYGLDTEQAEAEAKKDMGFLVVDFQVENTTNNSVDLYPAELVMKTALSNFTPVYFMHAQTNGLPAVTEDDFVSVYSDETYVVTVIFKVPKDEVSGIKNIGYDTVSSGYHSSDYPLSQFSIDIGEKITAYIIASLDAPPLYSGLPFSVYDSYSGGFSDDNISLGFNLTYSTSFYDDGESYSINTSVELKNRTAKKIVFRPNDFSLFMKTEYDNISYENQYFFDDVTAFKDEKSFISIPDGGYFDIYPGETKEVWFTTDIGSMKEKPVRFVYNKPSDDDGQNNYYPYDFEYVFD